MLSSLEAAEDCLADKLCDIRWPRDRNKPIQADCPLHALPRSALQSKKRTQTHQCSQACSCNAIGHVKASDAMQDAVGNRVTLKLKDGASRRIALPFRPTHLLPRLALDALSQALEPSVWHALLSSHLTFPGMLVAHLQNRHARKVCV